MELSFGGKMAKIDIASRLKGQLSKVETPKALSGGFLNFSDEHFDFSYLNELECDREIKDYLKEKSIQLGNLQGNTVLILGKICGEVAEELGKKGSPDGIYYKWLEFNGLSRNTALRYRKRYELFQMAESNRLKEIISLLNIKEIDEIYGDRENIMEILNSEKNPEIKSVKELIATNFIAEKTETSEILKVMEHPEMDRSFERFNNIMSNLKGANLSPKKQEKLQELLEKIEKLLG